MLRDGRARQTMEGSMKGLLFTLALVSTPFAAAPAAPADEAAADLPPALAGLAWYEGSWTSEQPAEGNLKNRITLTYAWMEGRKFMATQAVSAIGDLRTEARGFLGLDPETGTLTSWTFVSDGGMNVMRATSAPGADTLVFEGRPGGPGGAELRASFAREGPDAYRMLVEGRSGDRWVPAGSTLFRRARR
jgi:hypothetical protein